MDHDDFAPVPPRPMNWDELERITGGLSDVPIETIQAGRPDHDYHYSSSDMRKCGRLGCYKRHCNGVLVAISGRRFVNIGHCRASRYITNHDDWDQRLQAMRDRVDLDARDQALIAAREEALNRLYWLDSEPRIERAIHLLESFLQQARGPIRQELEARAGKRAPRVEIYQRLTDEDRDLRRVMLAGSNTVLDNVRVGSLERVTIGELSGLDCLRTGHTPRDQKRRLEQLIWTLLKWPPTTSAQFATDALRKATRDLIPCANDLEESVRNTERFLTPRNLELITRLEIFRRQGGRSIRVSGDAVEIVRAPHWGKAA